jgi:para-nitrobenzyl esterase
MSVEADWVNRCVADVAQCQLRGIYVDGVRVFRGVPCAASPVGNRRFKRPAPAPSWEAGAGAGPASIELNLANTARVQALAEEIDPGVRAGGTYSPQDHQYG